MFDIEILKMGRVGSWKVTRLLQGSPGSGRAQAALGLGPFELTLTVFFHCPQEFVHQGT